MLPESKQARSRSRVWEGAVICRVRQVGEDALSRELENAEHASAQISCFAA